MTSEQCDLRKCQRNDTPLVTALLIVSIETHLWHNWIAGHEMRVCEAQVSSGAGVLASRSEVGINPGAAVIVVG